MDIEGKHENKVNMLDMISFTRFIPFGSKTLKKGM